MEDGFDRFEKYVSECGVSFDWYTYDAIKKSILEQPLCAVSRGVLADFLDEQDFPVEAHRQRMWVSAYHELEEIGKKYGGDNDYSEKEFSSYAVDKMLGHVIDYIETGDSYCQVNSDRMRDYVFGNQENRNKFINAFLIVTGIPDNTKVPDLWSDEMISFREIEPYTCSC